MSSVLGSFFGWLVAVLPRILVHAAGIVVAIVLLRRNRSRATVVTLIAFVVLFITDLGKGLFQILFPLVLAPRAGSRLLETTSVLSTLCCTSLDAVAIVLLIIAFAQALGRPEEDEEPA
jgi:glycerol-3-phosphate acyltransferase PlsY